MKMFHKLAATASMLTLAATGAASALDITTHTIGGQAAPHVLANELDFTDSDASATLVALTEPTTGSLPSGNVLFDVTLTNAVFDGAVVGGNVVGIGTGCTNATASISSGGADGSAVVTFLVSNAQLCDVTGTEGLQFTADISPTGVGSVSLTTNLRTEANNQVDGPSVTETTVSFVSGISTSIVANTTVSQANLPDFETLSDGELGTVQVVLNPAANRQYGANPVVSTDIDSVTISVAGQFGAFGEDEAVFVDLVGGTGFDLGDVELAVVGGNASAVVSGAPEILALTTGARSIRVVEDGVTAIVASTYNATVTVNPDTGAAPIAYKAADEVTQDALDNIIREGTQITLPWFASATQTGLTGTSNLLRLGNLGSTPITAIYVEVLTSSLGNAFTNPGVVQLPLSILAGGTALVSSQSVEDAVGHWGTGDIQITVEADDDVLTAKRLIFNGTSITEIGSGTVADN